MEIRKILVNGIEYEFVCAYGSTRNGFKHSVSFFENSRQISEGVCHYINRTWECFSYQTAMLAAIQNKLDNIKEQLLYYFKHDNHYTNLTANRKQEFEKYLNENQDYIRYKDLYGIILDYDKYSKAVNY